ncbi:MFS transporter [Luteococcus sp. Sow4_B9]|uniref:MFS transporter n=1 Tax=Luteococcus sp. Sow4_B9 TaxID=3438792 RepID=UPI003F98F66D
MTPPSPGPLAPRDMPPRGPEPSLPDAAGWPFLVTAFVGRMPSSMVQLGYLLVLSQSGYGLAAGGLAVAAVGLGSAIGGPVVGRLVDRLGPLPALAGATLVSLVGQAIFLGLMVQSAPLAALLLCAGLVGAANPQVGPVARSHWSRLAVRLRAPHLVQRALGYEGAVDETGFVVGPVLAGALVTLLGPLPAVGAILALTLVLQGLFLLYLALDRANWADDPTPAGQPTVVAGGPSVGLLPVLWPMLGCLAVGTLFGATQTALTAVFDSRGTPGVTGLVYGFVGIGSGVASLLAARFPQSFGLPSRVLLGGLFVAAGALAMMTLPAAWLAAACGFVLGLGAGVILVTSFTWMEAIAPRHRMATMMTVLSTSITLGVSAGAATAGQLASVLVRGFWPLLMAAVLAVVASAGMRAHLPLVRSVRRG